MREVGHASRLRDTLGHILHEFGWLDYPLLLGTSRKSFIGLALGGVRTRAGRKAPLSAASIDSQSVKTTGVGGGRGYDGAKKISGRKRHLLVDTQRLVLQAKVHAADLQDRAALPILLDGATTHFPHIEHVWVEHGYTGAGTQWITAPLGW